MWLVKEEDQCPNHSWHLWPENLEQLSLTNARKLMSELLGAEDPQGCCQRGVSRGKGMFFKEPLGTWLSKNFLNRAQKMMYKIKINVQIDIIEIKKMFTIQKTSVRTFESTKS